MNYPVISFNAGELSPLIDARSDVEKYKFGCRTLENMIPRIYGPAERRPGTKYIDTAILPARVASFIYSNTIAYILLFEENRLYFYYDGARVLTPTGDRLTVTTPYAAADLAQLQMKQLNDVMWITHPDYPPYKLSRTSATSFTLTQIGFSYGPFKTRNDLDVDNGATMQPSVTTGTGILTVSSAFFVPNHVGALFSVVQPRVNTVVTGSKVSPATGVVGSALLVEGSFSFTTGGTWEGSVRLERSIDGTTWEHYRTWTNQIQYTGTEEEANVHYRINVVSLTSGTITVTLTVNSSTEEGICRITGFTSSMVVSMVVVKDFASTNADVRWSEGSWSPYRGYPACVTFFGDRCIYAGTPHQPQTVWFSAAGDYEYFWEGTNDDSAFWLTISSDRRNAIQWISALEAVLCGTTGGLWRIRSSAYDEPLTPTNFTMTQQTSDTNKAIQALPIGDVILFVDSVGRKIREATLDREGRDKYVAPDLCALAEHITESGIVAIAYQQHPDPILWAVRDDGTLLSMTYERDQNVVAWARHTTFGGSGRYSPVLGLAHDIPISTIQELQAMKYNLAGHYYLVNDIEGAGYAFTPVGTSTAPFTGSLDGCEYAISNLTITNAALTTGAGLFGYLSGATVYNLTITAAAITIYTNAGILAGFASGSTCQEVTVDGTIVANTGGFVGGFIGDGQSGGVNNTITSCTVSDVTITFTGYTAYCALFIGPMKGTCADCYASGTIVMSNGQWLGGFVGRAAGASVYIRCLATGIVPAQNTVAVSNAEITNGGFAGSVDSPYNQTFTDCYYLNTLNDRAFGGEDEVQRFSFNETSGNGPTSGHYHIVFGGTTSSGIPYNCTQAQAQAACDATFGTGVLEIKGDYPIKGNRFQYVYFRKSYARLNVDMITVDCTDLAGPLAPYTAAISVDNASVYPTNSLVPTGTTYIAPRTRVGDGIQSVAVIPSATEDEVWFLTSKNITSTQVGYLEQMQPRLYGDLEEAWFVDCGKLFYGDPATVFTGLDHLEDEEVAILGDGVVFNRQTVLSGSVTLDTAVSRAIIGLPFRSTLKPMRFDIHTTQGSTKGSLKRFAELVMSFFESAGAKYGVDVDTLFEIDWPTTGLYTGDKVVAHEGGFDAEDSVIITTDEPLPLIVRAMIPRIEKTGR